MPSSSRYQELPPRHGEGRGNDWDRAYDSADTCNLSTCVTAVGLARAESMDMTNDPRFFSKNIMDKRLSAFKQLTIVSTLMFGTALGQTFKMKKDMNFGEWQAYVGNIAIWQFAGFVIAVIVSIMCLISLYVIVHQLFYTYRLMTAGPTGFEQASVFYLTKVITMWRHFAIKCLFQGLTLFLVLVGLQLLVKFYKDADGVVKKKHAMYALNLKDGSSVNELVADMHAKNSLDMQLHSILAYIVLVIYTCCTIGLYVIRQQHMEVFKLNYSDVKGMTTPIETTMRQMSVRSKIGLDV
jgi:hypothetical protein